VARAALAGTGVLVGSVAGFPHGDTRTTVKAAETRALVEAGADEIDMVVHIAGSAAARPAMCTTTSPRWSPRRRAGPSR
jgi:deoxyribose-phosphate aldolase